MTEREATRADNFTDAAFAFAVTLMVVGGGGAAGDGGTLETAVAAIPSFVIGFATMAMFWWSHVRWRRLRGAGDARSLLLTLLLVFTVLIYVVPLRAMAASFAAFLVGDFAGYSGSLSRLFTVYGLGFTAMSALTAALYHDVRRRPDLSPDDAREGRGQVGIWSILAGTGFASTALALIPGFAAVAPFLYATLPISIGIFAWRFDWSGTPGKAEPLLAPGDVEAAGDDDRGADPGPGAGQHPEQDIAIERGPEQA
ncbi:DUF1211 domain-containing protein [Sphingomonas suaedae]|uniref:DUF1211 domain-containing protein n=1 Tax=Sphingomonas suaedae TaxID=2599297 RepID=A0A518RFQ6_9SPHN|nr:DUF1211 domain-containing protein [Sphingomonas suaedae]